MRPNCCLAGGQGFFYADALVCAFMWAADNGIQVTSNSYGADPWVFACRDQPEQNAVVVAVGRHALEDITSTSVEGISLCDDKIQEPGSRPPMHV